jgi:D-mannonate dehydratase
MEGLYTTDHQVVNSLKKFQNLESIEVEYSWRIVCGWVRTRLQYTEQNTPLEILRFRQLTGHDALCALRGLKRIQLIGDFKDSQSRDWRFLPEDLEMYEDFLTALVTQPKPTQAEIEAKAKAQLKLEAEEIAIREAKEERIRSNKRRRMKRKPTGKLMGDDDEYDGTWD